MDDQTMFDLFDSLNREFKQDLESVRREVSDVRHEIRGGFQRVDARQGREGGMIPGGPRQVARPVTWSEEIDQIIAERDQRIEGLAQRLAELEKRLSPQAA